MKALIIQIIFILCELAVAAPFVFYVEKLRKDHEKWRRWLSSEIFDVLLVINGEDSIPPLQRP